MRPFPPKDPSEIIYLGFSYARLLESGETISSATWRVEDSDGKDAAALLSGLAAVSGAVVKQKVVAGTLGETYRHFCTATTSTGRVLVLDNFQTISIGGACE